MAIIRLVIIKLLMKLKKAFSKIKNYAKTTKSKNIIKFKSYDFFKSK